MPRFIAQSLAQTRISEDQRRLEFTFIDGAGGKQSVSLPVGVVADLIPVLNSLTDRGTNRARFTKLPRRCAVGSANHERLVLIRFDDDPPYGLDPEVAETLWRQVREETRDVSRLKAPALQ
jgi:hypothetical protein